MHFGSDILYMTFNYFLLATESRDDNVIVTYSQGKPISRKVLFLLPKSCEERNIEARGGVVILQENCGGFSTLLVAIARRFLWVGEQEKVDREDLTYRLQHTNRRKRFTLHIQ